jgi:uncharacterized protein YxeA
MKKIIITVLALIVLASCGNPYKWDVSVVCIEGEEYHIRHCWERTWKINKTGRKCTEHNSIKKRDYEKN